MGINHPPSLNPQDKEYLGEKVEMESSEEVRRGAEDVEIEFAQAEEEEEEEEEAKGCVCERPNEFPLEKMSGEASAGEEVAEAGDDSAHCGCGGGRMLPNMGTVIDISVADPANEEVAAPFLGRASIWNCCGLLDAFKGSQR